MQINNPSSGGSSYVMQPSGSNGVYTSALRNSTASGTSQATANQAVAYLVDIPGNCNLAATIYLGGAGVAGGLFYAGLYNADAVDGLPSTLAFSFGEFDLTVAGTKSLAPATVRPGRYWLFTHNKLITGATDFTTSTLANGENTLLIVSGGSFNFLTSTANAYAPAVADISAYAWTPTSGTVGAKVHFKIS